MRTSISLVAILTAALSLPAVAQDLEAMGDALFAEIQRIDAESGVRDIAYADLHGTGVQSALVQTDACEEDVCRWDLVAHDGGAYRVSGSSIAEEVRFEPTEGGGQVIWSDGVTWAFNGNWIMPWGSLLDDMPSRDGTEAEHRLVLEHKPFFDGSDMHLTVYEAALLGNGWNQRAIFIGGLCCMAGPSGYPFMIVDHEGEILVEGTSIDAPQLFRKSSGDVAVISQGVSGYRIYEIGVEGGEK